MVMSLGEDHTRGMSPGQLSPESSVASNDLALGKMIDAITHSKFWPETAIFVIEDDAQNGPDHVDAHRTVGLVISPYTKRNAVDSTHYTTSSFVRTIETILDIPTMTQFDTHATPMYESFMTKPDLTPYSMLDERLALDVHNPETGTLSMLSKKLDFSDYDRADPNTLNYILYEALRHEPAPAPVRSIESQ
jgi:hypothetical protein